MAIITQDMLDVIESAKLMFVATVRPDGTPNVSPKGSVRALDSEHLIFADIASPGTVENVRTCPEVEINVVDFISRRGYRFRGSASILDPGEANFDRIIAWLRETHGDRVPCNHAVRVRVTETAELLSPAYTFEHVAEPALRAAWMQKYHLARG